METRILESESSSLLQSLDDDVISYKELNDSLITILPLTRTMLRRVEFAGQFARTSRNARYDGLRDVPAILSKVVREVYWSRLREEVRMEVVETLIEYIVIGRKIGSAELRRTGAVSIRIGESLVPRALFLKKGSEWAVGTLKRLVGCDGEVDEFVTRISNHSRFLRDEPDFKGNDDRTNRSRHLVQSCYLEIVRTIETIQSQILAMLVTEARGNHVEVKKMKRLESMLYDISEKVASSIRDSIEHNENELESYVNIIEALLCGESTSLRCEIKPINSSSNVADSHLRLARKWLAIGNQNNDSLCNTFLRVVANEPRVYNKLSEFSKMNLRAFIPSVWERELLIWIERENANETFFPAANEHFYLAIPRLHVLAVHMFETEILKGDDLNFWDVRMEKALYVLRKYLGKMLSQAEQNRTFAPGSMGWWRCVATRTLMRRAPSLEIYDYDYRDHIRGLKINDLSSLSEHIQVSKLGLDLWLYLLAFPEVFDRAVLNVDREQDAKFVRWYLRFACAIVLERSALRDDVADDTTLKSRVLSRSNTRAAQDMADDLFKRIVKVCQEAALNESNGSWVETMVKSPLPSYLSSRIMISHLRYVNEKNADLNLLKRCPLEDCNDHVVRFLSDWRDELKEGSDKRAKLGGLCVALQRGGGGGGKKRLREGGESPDTKRKCDAGKLL